MKLFCLLSLLLMNFSVFANECTVSIYVRNAGCNFGPSDETRNEITTDIKKALKAKGLVTVEKDGTYSLHYSFGNRTCYNFGSSPTPLFYPVMLSGDAQLKRGEQVLYEATRKIPALFPSANPAYKSFGKKVVRGINHLTLPCNP